MDRISCKSCGGALQKISETAYKCMFCGTVHELGLDDSESVRALLERNNQRWIYINKRMDQFYAAVNRAAGHEIERGSSRVRAIAGVFIAVVLLGMMGFAFLANPADFTEKVGPKGVGVAVSLVLVMEIVFLIMWFNADSQLKAALAEARGIAADVLATYRQMSEKPPRDLLESLNNAKFLASGTAERLASQIYDEVSVPPPAAAA